MEPLIYESIKHLVDRTPLGKVIENLKALAAQHGNDTIMEVYMSEHDAECVLSHPSILDYKAMAQ